MKFGLRAKSVLALCFAIAIVALLAVAAGWRALESVEANLGQAYARNATEYKKQRILAPVERELALSQRLADSEVTRRWLLDENDPAKKALFFAEAERYRHAFEDQSYFLINATSRHYYFSDRRKPANGTPSYSLSPTAPQDAWFFKTMKGSEPFNINVDYDVKLKSTKVWFNVVSKAAGRNIGLAGTGFDLTTFLNRYITAGETGVTPMILDARGAIQAYPDRRLIDYSSVSDKGSAHSLVYRLLTGRGDDSVMNSALKKAATDADAIPEFWADLNGRRKLFAVSYIPELKWFIVTAVDLKAARVIDGSLWLPLFFVGAALLIVFVLVIMLAVNRILLAPLLTLTESARALASGNYSLELPAAGHDELGELTRAFGAMAAQVRTHTDELEGKVAQRTNELVLVNQCMAQASQKIGDSIEYASLIQNAILPAAELQRVLPGRHFVLWRPRDIVGGDIFIFRATDDGFLCGVIDCAGHGVPGAFMTMIAHSALDVAIETLGLQDPAALLEHVDARVRAMLALEPGRANVTAHMDAGLVYVDRPARQLTFAGAKIALYCCEGSNISVLKGDRYAIGGKRDANFVNRSAPLAVDTTYYLTTDGLLDQAGGPAGYSFGNARFAALLLSQAHRPCDQQQSAFAQTLAAYQGHLPQRDDITVLGFSGNP